MADENNGAGFVGGFLLGALVGAGIAILLAPEAGQDTRARLRTGGTVLRSRADDVLAQAKDQATDMLREARERSEDLMARGRAAVEEQRGMLREAFDEGRASASRTSADLQEEFRKRQAEGA